MEVQWDQDEAHTCDAPRPEYWISFDTKEEAEAVIELLERLLHEQT
ncbi:hypothetical protein LCGC14_3106830 [marine sediment metagenome]|uniref:Uncharacterized protein n=1 Tax=marine sediment metagenome TaxID=412755 RepID=A0A0F8YDR8_9ZZZZ